MGDLTPYQTQTQSDAALRDLFFHHKLPCPGHNHPHPTPCPPGDGPQLCAVAESTSIVFCMTPPAAVPPGALGWNDSQLTSLDQDHPPSCSSGVCFPRAGASFLRKPQSGLCVFSFLQTMWFLTLFCSQGGSSLLLSLAWKNNSKLISGKAFLKKAPCPQCVVQPSEVIQVGDLSLTTIQTSS